MTVKWCTVYDKRHIHIILSAIKQHLELHGGVNPEDPQHGETRVGYHLDLLNIYIYKG